MSPTRKASLRPDPAAADAATLETAFAALQEVVQQLEAGGLTLEQTVALYDRGQALAAAAEQFLAHAELRITRLPAETASPLSDVAQAP